MLALLDTLVQIYAWLVVVVPIATLVFGIVFYFSLPSQRKAIGLVLITFGSFGLALFGIVLYIAAVHVNEPIIFVAMFAVELATLILGIISLTCDRVKAKDKVH